jgi:transcription initiation factor TFIIE subunit alpha
MKHKILRKLEGRLEYELGHEFYHCGKNSCSRITFEEAMETVFNCPFCQEPLEPKGNDPYVEFLERKIEEIQGELDA